MPSVAPLRAIQEIIQLATFATSRWENTRKNCGRGYIADGGLGKGVPGVDLASLSLESMLKLLTVSLLW